MALAIYSGMKKWTRKNRLNWIWTLAITAGAVLSISPFGEREEPARQPANIVDLNRDWQQYGLENEANQTLFSRAAIDPLAPMDPQYVGVLAEDLRSQIADVPSLASLAHSFDDDGNPEFLAMDPADYKAHMQNVLSGEVVSYWQRRQAFAGVGIDTDAIWEASLGKSVDGAPVFDGSPMPQHGFFQQSVGGVPGGGSFWSGIGTQGRTQVGPTTGAVTRQTATGTNRVTTRPNAVGFKPAGVSGASSVPYQSGRRGSRMDYTSWSGGSAGSSRAAY